MFLRTGQWTALRISAAISVGALLLMMLVPSACADLLPPPIERVGGGIPVAKLNIVLEMLQGDGVPIRLIYQDTRDIEVTIPNRFAVKARNRGLVAPPGKSAGAAVVRDTSCLTLVRNVVLGVTLSACCIAAFIWLARRPSWLALAGAIIVVSAAGTVGTLIVLMELNKDTADRPIPESTMETKGEITITAVESGDSIRVHLPMRFKPAWMGAVNETTYPSPLRPRAPRPERPGKDK